MVTHEDARRAWTGLQGFGDWKVPSQKVLSVSWSTPLQGLAANIERYRNSPVMHQDVPDHFKPLLFKCGQPVRFPRPRSGFGLQHRSEDKSSIALSRHTHLHRERGIVSCQLKP